MFTLLTNLLTLLFPKLPKWLVLTFTELVRAIMTLVEAAEASAMDFAAWAHQIEKMLDRALDNIPGWTSLSEADRDAVLKGLRILVTWIYDLTQRDAVTNKVLRRSFKAAGKRLVDDLRLIETGHDFTKPAIGDRLALINDRLEKARAAKRGES